MALNSFIMGNIWRSFTTTHHNNYADGSLFIKFIFGAGALVFGALKSIFLFFARLNDTSINKKITAAITGPFRDTNVGVVGFISRTVAGCFPSKFAVWLFTNEKSQSDSEGSFITLRLMFCVFVLGFSIIPHHLWSNMLILGAALFFWGAFALQYFLSENKPGVDTKYIAPSLVLYVFFCVVSFFTGFGGFDSVRVASIMFSSIAIGLLIPNIFTTKEQLKQLIIFVFVALVLSSLFGLYQAHMGIAIREDFVDMWANIGMPGRLYSTMGNPNNFAKFLIMLLPFCIAHMFIAKCEIKKLFLLGLNGIILIAMVLTFSRASYLALGGVFGVLVLLLKPRLIPIGILGAIIAIPFLPDVIINRIMTIGTDTSSLYRVLIWEGAARTVANYWSSGIGIGPDAFTSIYRAHAASTAGNAMHAHNVFLNVWVEVGIGGFIAIILYNLKTFKTGVATFYKTQDIEIKYYLAAGVSALTAFLMFSIVEHVWFYPRTMLTYFVMMGIIWALIRIETRAQ